MILILGLGLRMVKKALPRCLVLIATLALLAPACANTQPNRSGPPLIVATTTIVGDIVTNVVGTEAEVRVLMPAGVDAHEFTPSAQQAAELAQADLIVANGLGLEEGLSDVIGAAVADGVDLIELGPLADPIPLPPVPGSRTSVGGDEDPHFWMDPIRVGMAAQGLATALSRAFPGRDWDTGAAAYVETMAVADETIREILAVVTTPDRAMVTNHESFGYFADRYGFRIVGAVIPGGSTLASPSSSDLADLVAKMEAEGTRVIFAETTQPTTLAVALAGELGEPVDVVLLYTESLGEPGSDAATLDGMLETNAKHIAEALG